MIGLQRDINTSRPPRRILRKGFVVTAVSGVGVRVAAERVTARGDAVAIIGGVSTKLRAANSRPGGRPRQAQKDKNNFKVGTDVETVIPRFIALFERKSEPKGALRKTFSQEFIDVAFGSRTVEAAARRFVAGKQHLDYDTVANYHRAYKKLSATQTH